MSTIPSTPERETAYTVLGSGSAPPPSLPISVVLLNRGTRLYRAKQLQELERMGFAEVISVETAAERPELEGLAARLGGVRFILPVRPLNAGEAANLGFREARGDFVLLLWNDMRLAPGGFSSRFVERLAERDLLCATPWLQTRDGEPLPAVAAPAFEGAALRVLSLAPRADGEKALFPLDYAGVYARARFLASGGFDAGMDAPWWQLLDFGFRAWLRGEELRSLQALRLMYEEAPPSFDSSSGPDYRRFHLRNLAPVLSGDAAHLPWSRYLPFALRSGRSPVGAFREFREARAWVAANAFRFKTDARALLDLWEPLS